MTDRRTPLTPARARTHTHACTHVHAYAHTHTHTTRTHARTHTETGSVCDSQFGLLNDELRTCLNGTGAVGAAIIHAPNVSAGVPVHIVHVDSSRANIPIETPSCVCLYTARTCPSINPSIHPFIRPSVHPSIYPSSTHPSMHPAIHAPSHPFIVHPSIRSASQPASQPRSNRRYMTCTYVRTCQLGRCVGSHSSLSLRRMLSRHPRRRLRNRSAWSSSTDAFIIHACIHPHMHVHVPSIWRRRIVWWCASKRNTE